MRRLFLGLCLFATVGCASPKPVARLADDGRLNGNKLGADFLGASAARQLTYCTASVKAYRTSGVQSFSVSPSIGNLTPQTFCEQLTDYIKDEQLRREERLSQASATAMLLYARPKTRQRDTELEGMQSGTSGTR